MEVCIELALVANGYHLLLRELMRLSVTLEKKFPNMQEWQLQQILDLCDIAMNHGVCLSKSSYAFFKVAISLKDPQSLFRARISRDELIARTTNGSEPQITIRWNVLPIQGYWTKLQEVCHRLPWTREFYSRQVIEESLSEGKSLMEKLKERRQTGAKCELARSLEPCLRRDYMHLARLWVNIRIVDPTELVEVKRLAKGSEGTVCKVVWGNCTYAMKSFVSEEGSFSNELGVATNEWVFHPHIVQAFGRSPDAMDDGQPFLLMELLDGDLLRCVYEYARATDVTRLSFSRVDRLDVLLQIGSAVRQLHDNEVVHGDLKLGNILLSESEISGNVRHFLAKVADFGSVKFTEPSFEPNGGTTEYASPEVLQWRIDHGVRLLNPRKLDVYSFGVVAYEVLTGHVAFNGKLDTREKIRQVSTGEKKLIDSTEWRKLKGGFGYFDGVITLVESCLEFDPEERPEFSTICDELTESKFILQDLEKKVAAYQNLFVTLSAIFVMWFIFRHYVPRVWITVVLLMVSTFSIGSWACRNFRSIRLKSKIV